MPMFLRPVGANGDDGLIDPTPPGGAVLDSNGLPFDVDQLINSGVIAPSKPTPPGGAVLDSNGLPFDVDQQDSKLPTEDFEDYSNVTDAIKDDSEFGPDSVLPEISAPDNPPTDEEKDNEPTDEEDTTLKDASVALNVFSKVLDLVKNLLKTKADSDLKKGMDNAKKNITEGQDKMINSGENVNNALNGLSDANSKYTDFAKQFSEIQSTLSSQLAKIASMTSDLSGLNAQLSNQTAQLNQAQARLDQAIARTDLSLPQKRVEIRSANYDLMQKSLAVNDTNFNLATVTDSLNSAGSQYNQTLSQASEIRYNVSTSYAQAQTFQNALNTSVGQYNQGAQQYSQGFQGLKNSVGDYQSKINELVPIAETSAGASGVSKILNSIDNGKYAQATGDALLSGVDAYARNGGPVELSLARALIGAGVDSASHAVDRAFASGDWSNVGSNFAKDFGQATVRTNDMQKVGEGIDLAYTIFNNTSNLYNASQVLVQQVGTIFQIGTTVAQTGSVLFPGAQAISPAIGIIGPTLGTGAQGLAQTVVETGNKLYINGISAQVSESSPRIVAGGVVRGLVTYPSGSGGATSVPTTGALGVLTSLASMAKQAVVGSLTNQNFAMQASSTIYGIANTGLPSAGVNTKISAGSFTLRAGVDTRPPSADPVGGTTVAY